MKLGQLEQATFEALRDQITGGDIAATHLVKGLDRKLLERVRRGEDVTGAKEEVAEDVVDEELERLEEREVEQVAREKTEKKRGEMAPPKSVAGAKRTRDQILAELKAQRKAAAEARLAARPELGSQFRAISVKQNSGPRIERDDKGREVMITVDEHGNVKKKVRKVQVVEEPVKDASVAIEKTFKFLDEGITLPVLKEQKTEVIKEDSEEEEDIFADAGTEYNPLGDEEEDDSSDDEDGEVPSSKSAVTAIKDFEAQPPRASESPSVSPVEESPSPKENMPPPPLPASASNKPATIKPRNYFKSSLSETAAEAPPHQNPFNDDAFLAAIKKASALSNVSFSLSTLR